MSRSSQKLDELLQAYVNERMNIQRLREIYFLNEKFIIFFFVRECRYLNQTHGHTLIMIKLRCDRTFILSKNQRKNVILDYVKKLETKTYLNLNMNSKNLKIK